MSIIHNIAGYKFITLECLTTLRADMVEKCKNLGMKGTILLSHEGINISLAGTQGAMACFKSYLLADERFSDISFRESLSTEQPFKRMKIKLKKEIITMRTEGIQPEHVRAPSISPKEFKQWLDENKDIMVLDTRNDYEMQFGAFDNAVNLHIKDFGEFPSRSKLLPKNKPIVMYCTGGVRCEKAAIYMQNEGFENVYQLEGGILNYFAEVGADHYHGDCFVFDDRVALNAKLQASDVKQCCHCQQPVKQTEDHVSCSIN